MSMAYKFGSTSQGTATGGSETAKSGANTMKEESIQKFLMCRHCLEGHGGWVAECAITQSCSVAITVAGDDLAVVWDLPTGTCQNVLEGHSDELLSVELTRKGRFAITGSMDGTAKIWDLQAKSAHLQQAHSGRVHGLVVSPDQSKVISFGEHLSTGLSVCGMVCFINVRWESSK